MSIAKTEIQVSVIMSTNSIKLYFQSETNYLLVRNHKEKLISVMWYSSDGTSSFEAPKGKSSKFAHHSFYEESTLLKNNIN